MLRKGKAEQGGEGIGTAAVVTQLSGDGATARAAQQIEGGVAQHRQHIWPLSFAYLAAILP